MTTAEPKRRKGPKDLPKLPLHIFSPPNSGAADKFPLLPSPSAVHPSGIVDTHVLVKSKDEAGGQALEKWRSEIAERGVEGKVQGVVVSLQTVDEADLDAVVEKVRSISNSSPAPIISIGIPYAPESGSPSAPEKYASDSQPPVHFVTALTQSSQEHAKGVNWALQEGYVVDIDVQLDLADGEVGWEALEDFINEALGPVEQRKGTLIISSVLPPPHQLSTPIVKLLNDHSYITYQGRISSLSLFPNVCIKFLPPNWNAPTPPSPGPTGSSKPSTEQQEKDAKEWKRRIKMYLGPAVEAFGYQRILFGTSPSPASSAPSNAGDWYELARESFAELGLEQEDIDAVFCNNAKTAYRGSL